MSGTAEEPDGQAEQVPVAQQVEMLRKRALAVGLGEMGIAKIVDAYPTPAEGLQALIEEIERRERFRTP